MGFQDTFTNQEGGEQNLQYDDTAFRYFFLAILTSIIIPLLICIFKPFLINPSKSKLANTCPCKSCKQKANKLYKNNKYNFITKGYKVKIFIVIILVILAYKNYNKIDPNNQTIKKFDPWEILEIEPNSDLNVIKKAFRKLSRMYHPDVAKDLPEATAKFIMVQKAHECLTDETKRDICAKYGSPDGPGKMNVAIAMPSFLLDKNNHVMILFIFFILLLVILPSTIYMMYIADKNVDQFGTMKANYKIFYRELNENVLSKTLIEVLAQCLEFRKIKINKQQSEDLYKILKSLDDEYAPSKKLPKEIYPVYILICAHLLRIKVPKTLETNYSIVITKCPQILQSMISFIMSVPFFKQRIPVQMKNTKFFGLQPVKKIIALQQQMVQGMTSKTPSIFQLSYFNHNSSDIRNKKVQSIKELVSATQENRKLNFVSDEEQQKEVNKELDIFPNFEVTHFVGIEDEKQITDNDAPKIEVKIKTLNLKNKQQKSLVHAPFFPSFKLEKWHFIIATENDDIVHYELVIPEDNEKVVNLTSKFPIGSRKLIIYAMPDSYVGFDFEKEDVITILDHRTVKREYIVNETDQNLDKEVTFLESMLTQLAQKDDANSDEDEEEDENENKLKKQQKSKNNKESDSEEEEVD